MIERIRLATLSVHVSPHGGFHCAGRLGRMSLIAEPGLPTRAGLPTIDVLLVGDDAEEVHARLRRALLEPAPKGAGAMANRRNGVRA